MKSLIYYIYSRPLWVVWVAILAMVVIWTIINIYVEKDKQYCWGQKCINIGVLFVEIIGILYMTIISRTTGEREVCLIPLYSFVRASEQPELYRSMVMNILLFVPFGLVMPYTLKKTCVHKLQITILMVLLISSIIELLQYVFYLGRVETDDVIFNITGAVIGCMSYWLYDWIEKRFLKR